MVERITFLPVFAESRRQVEPIQARSRRNRYIPRSESEHLLDEVRHDFGDARLCGLELFFRTLYSQKNSRFLWRIFFQDKQCP